MRTQSLVSSRRSRLRPWSQVSPTTTSMTSALRAAATNVAAKPRRRTSDTEDATLVEPVDERRPEQRGREGLVGPAVAEKSRRERGHGDVVERRLPAARYPTGNPAPARYTRLNPTRSVFGSRSTAGEREGAAVGMANQITLHRTTRSIRFALLGVLLVIALSAAR